jgi:hypothetical protein
MFKSHSLFGDTSSCNAYQKPKLPIFSGEEKSETSFDVWKLEEKCVLREGNYQPYDQYVHVKTLSSGLCLL